MAVGICGDRQNTVFDLGKKSVCQNRSAFCFVMIQCFTEISSHESMECLGHSLSPKFSLDFRPSSSGSWIFSHLRQSTCGFGGAVIGIR